jgi:arsenical pump membrane protein
VVLRALHKRELAVTYEPETEPLTLTRSGRLALAVVSTALALLVVAAGIGLPVGYAALVLGAIAVAVVALADRTTPRRIAREAPWSILPLVAGLFVVMRALDATGVLEHARALLRDASTMHPILGRLYAGTAVTIADALVNNLPVGVAARYALHAQGIAPHVAHAVLVGVDLGPNLSINASLATLLWAMMLRREGIAVNAWRFLLIGAAVTIPSLALALIVVR